MRESDLACYATELCAAKSNLVAQKLVADDEHWLDVGTSLATAIDAVETALQQARAKNDSPPLAWLSRNGKAER